MKSSLKKTKKTILLVDDDEQFSSYMKEMLGDQGFNVVTADNGDSGLTEYTYTKPDLVITDIVMPEKEGIELILTIRETDSTTPIIAISGGNLGNADSYLNMAKKLGVNAVLAKPFSMIEILGEIQKLLPSE